MVIVRLKGGLGNQFFQYAAGYTLAKKLNCELKLDDSLYSQQTLRAFDLSNFNIETNIAHLSESLELGAPLNFANKLIRKLKLSSVLLRNYMEETQSFIYDERIDTINAPIYLDGYWQNLNYFEQYSEELRVIFTPKVLMSKMFERYLNQIKSSQSVSMHVRRGDYVSDLGTQSIHNVCGLNYYKKAIDHIKNNVDNPTFFVFSDDIAWCKKNLPFLKKKVFVEETTNAIEDFQLMRSCQINIIANSTFSWWSAWLSGSEKNILPALWQKDVPTNTIFLNSNNWIIL